MASNATFVCLTCRNTARRPENDLFPVCPTCKAKMVIIGKHWRVPKRKDDKGWMRLRGMIAKKLLQYGHSRL